MQKVNASRYQGTELNKMLFVPTNFMIRRESLDILCPFIHNLFKDLKNSYVDENLQIYL